MASLAKELTPDELDCQRELALINLPANRYKNMDLALWSVPLTPTSSPKHILTYLTSHCVDYTHAKWVDEDLLGAYCEDFKGWTEDMFSNISVEYKRTLKTILRNGGVYTGIWNGAIGKQLTNLLQADALPEWEDRELIRSEVSPRSRWYQRYTQLKNGTLRAQSTPAIPPPPAGLTPPPGNELGGPAPQVPGRNHPAATSPENSSTTAQNPIPPIGDVGNTSTNQQAQQQQSSPLLQTPTIQLATHNPYFDLPPRNVPNEALDVIAVTNFNKGWLVEDSYKGELYDVFDDTVRIFLRLCLGSRIEPSQFHAVFSRVMAGRARKYYMAHVTAKDTFAVAYSKLKINFDTDVNQQLYHKAWQSIDYSTIRRENPDKTPHEALELMFDKLHLCQRALGPTYAGGIPLRAQIMQACRKSTELASALNKPAADPAELMADLRATLI
jgi:hypothetical protein